MDPEMPENRTEATSGYQNKDVGPRRLRVVQRDIICRTKWLIVPSQQCVVCVSLVEKFPAVSRDPRPTMY